MDLQLYDLTEIQSLRRCDITADMSGNWNDADNLLNVDAIVNDLVFNDYTYSPIVLQGEYNRNSITANISTDDPNVSLLADATYNRNSNKKLKLMLTAGTFRPKRLNLIKTDKEMFRLTDKEKPLKPYAETLSLKDKYHAFFINAGMIISCSVFLLMTIANLLPVSE